MRKILLAAVAMLALAAPAAEAQQKTTLKFAVFTPDKELTHVVVMKPWAERVTKDSAGALEVTTFPNGALGRNPATQLKMIDDGVAEIAWVIPAYTPGVFKDDGVFELPNVIQNSTEGSRAAWRLHQRGLLAGYGNYKMIGVFVTAPYTFHMKTKVASMDDLKGKKVRGVGPVTVDAMKRLGIAVESMPVTQVVEAIGRGVIDGSNGHPIAIYDFGIAKVTSHHYLGQLGTVTLAIFMNKKAYEALPAPARAAIDKHSGEALSVAFGKMSDERNAELIAEWKKDKDRTVVQPGAEEVKRWDATLAPVVAEFEAKHPNGKALVAALREELAKIRAGQ